MNGKMETEEATPDDSNQSAEGSEEEELEEDKRQRTRDTVKELASALAQVARGLESKYLKPPLSGEDERKQKQQQKKPAEEKEEGEGEAVAIQPKTAFQRWEESLLASTSLSQVCV